MFSICKSESTNAVVLLRQFCFVYSYFEKGCCREKLQATSRKVFWVVLRSLVLQRKLAREATDICLRLLKESNENRFDSYGG